MERGQRGRPREGTRVEAARRGRSWKNLDSPKLKAEVDSLTPSLTWNTVVPEDPWIQQSIKPFRTSSHWCRPGDCGWPERSRFSFIGRFACGVARKAVRRGLESRGVDASLVPFISNLVYFILLAAVIIAVLGLFGIETTSLVALLGTAGLAIGLALQGTLANFSSGVMLLLFRPFRVGDYIEAAGAAGTVSEIGVFSTTLNTPDNVRIIVPNSGIFGATIKNFSANDTRRNDIVLGISYDDDIANAIAVVNAVLSKDSRVLSDPEPDRRSL